MSWNRQHSNIEELMVKVLKKHKALSLQEIVVFLGKSEDVPFTGKTPSNSLFSIYCSRHQERHAQ